MGYGEMRKIPADTTKCPDCGASLTPLSDVLTRDGVKQILVCSVEQTWFDIS